MGGAPRILRHPLLLRSGRLRTAAGNRGGATIVASDQACLRTLCFRPKVIPDWVHGVVHQATIGVAGAMLAAQ